MVTSASVGQVSWFRAGGSLGPEEPSYVTRQADAELYERLQEGKFCYVLNSRQMGKSSLRVRTMVRLRAEGWACASFDLTGVTGSSATAWQWFAGIVTRLASGLGLRGTVNARQWLRERQEVEPLELLREFIADVALVEVTGPIAIFIDEIDNVLRLGSFTDDLFAFIRWCYNQRAEQPKYERLTFALFGVATPGDLIQDKKITPFNIGTGIALAGFTEAEARVLVAGLKETAEEPEKALREILNWTGGQPFLTQRSCQLVVENFTALPAGTEAKEIARLLRERVVGGWEDRDEQRHFQTIRERLWRDEAQVSALLGLYGQVLAAGDAGRAVTGSAEEMELRLTGLVVRRDGHLRVYNRLYREVFSAEWVTGELAKLRPYAEALQAWEASGRKDASRLLGGKALEEALQWRQGKGLSLADQDFLYASQQRERVTLRQAVDVLEQARQRAGLLLWGAGATLAVSLAGAGVLQYRARLDFREANAVLRSSFAFTRFENNPFQSLLQAMQASRQFPEVPAYLPQWFQVESLSRARVAVVLQQAAYGVRERNALQGHEGWVNGVAFAPDGKTLASTGSDGTVKLWSVAGEELQTLQGHEGVVYGVAFAPDGKTLASTGLDGTVKLWSVAGEELQMLQGHEGWVYGVAFAPDGKTLASTGSDGTVKLWSVAGEKLQTLRGHEGEVVGVAFAPDGKTLASTGSDGTVKLWSVAGEELQTLRGHEGWVYGVAFAPDGKTLASTGFDGTVKLWSVAGEELQTLQGHEGRVYGVAFAPDGKTLASTGSDGTVKLWSVAGEKLQTLQGHEGEVVGVAFAPDGKTLASTGSDGTVKLWSVAGEELQTLQGHEGVVYGVAFAPDGKTLASTGSDGTVKLWSVAGEELQTLQGHEGVVVGVAFAPDGKTLASTGLDGTVKLWSVAGEELQTLQGHEGGFEGVAFAPDGKTLASTGFDGTVKLWSVAGEELQMLQGHEGWVWGVAFAPDGKTLASTGFDGTVKLWSVAGEELQTLQGHEGWVWGVAFAPDGKTLASTGFDGTVKLWSVAGEELQTLQGHEGVVYGVAFAPDGKTLASTGSDGTVKLWSVAGEELQTLQGHEGWVYGVAFAPDGKTLASTGVDGTVKLWNLDLADLTLRGCQWLRDYFATDDRREPELREFCAQQLAKAKEQE